MFREFVKDIAKKFDIEDTETLINQIEEMMKVASEGEEGIKKSTGQFVSIISNLMKPFTLQSLLEDSNKEFLLLMESGDDRIKNSA